MSIIVVKNPATHEVIAEIPKDSPETISKNFIAAQRAQKEWGRLPLSARIACVEKFHRLLRDSQERLATDLTRETGKPISQSRSELAALSSRIEFFTSTTANVLEQRNVSPKNSSVQEFIENEPLGVIANISAWNYPYFVGLNVIIPALLTGNAVMYKPSEFAILTGQNLASLFHQSGIDPGVFCMVTGGRIEGECLLDQSVDGIFFTGSLATGQAILTRARSRMIPIQLELGGKDGIYVCEDSDLRFCVPSIAEGAFYNTGQGCCSVERIFVHKRIFDQFIDSLRSEVERYKIGDPTDAETFIGPLTRESHIQFLKEQIAEATRSGARVVLGGHKIARVGNFFAPTIVHTNDTNLPINQNESFGPIVTVESVSDDKDAIARLNDSPFGLTSGVYSQDNKRAMDILKHVDTATAYINCCDRVSPRLPWSGRKLSGIGTTLSEDGIRCFTRTKAWHIRSLPS